MPITFRVAAHTPTRFSKEQYGATYSDPLTVLSRLDITHKPACLLQSSVDGSKDISVRKNGFVIGALLAYNNHHNLVIRPDDVWIAILSQLNFYINAHAEELRDKFVDHQGKKELVVVTEQPMETADFGDMSVQMTGQIDKNVKDKSLVPWLLPDFSTTTSGDTVICSAITMATLQKYFEYTFICACGIPQITLEGTQSDWQSILDRIDKIREFGPEPEEWAKMLRVILHRFVRAFDQRPEGAPIQDVEFWERMIHQDGGSGINYISGWMSAFCAWNERGKFQLKGQRVQQRSGISSWTSGVSFDGVWFPRVNDFPQAYSEVEVKVKDMFKGEEYDCMLLAGHVGVTFGGEKELDTISMAPQWFMYVRAGADGAMMKRSL